jgi:hypothetical protein
MLSTRLRATTSDLTSASHSMTRWVVCDDKPPLKNVGSYPTLAPVQSLCKKGEKEGETLTVSVSCRFMSCP